MWLVSRTEPELSNHDGAQRTWIQADLSQSGAGTLVANAIHKQMLDVMIYNAGIWEDSAFSSAYDFEKVSDAENERVLQVNLVSAITCVQKLLPNVRQSANGKIILIGSINGLENTRMPEVAYNASKFGLRGMAHGLREVLRKDKIAVTCINPGWIDGSGGVPYSDLIEIVRCLMRLTNRTCVKEMDVPAMSDENV